MKNYLLTLTFTFLLSMNLLYGQESDGSKEINLFPKDTIYEMPVYIPILESEEDSIQYGYKIINEDTIAVNLENDTTISQPKPFMLKKVMKPIFPGGDEELLKFIYQNIKLDYNVGKSYSKGYTTVKFKVTKIGYVRDAEIIKSSLSEYDEAIKNVIVKIPAYVPLSTLPPDFYCILSIAYPIEKK